MNNAVSGELDDLVEAYEEARLSGSKPDLRNFVSRVEDPNYLEIVVELVRVDLEHNWQSGQRLGVAHYCRLFPALLDSRESLASVAFEEYRQRRLLGEDVAKLDFADEFGIATDSWPELPVGELPDQDATLVCTDSILRELSRVDSARAGRLAAGQRQLPAIGDLFLEFHLVGELGRGAFGRVYLARQGDLAERFVALKITPHLSDEPNRLAQLQHTNIVPIYSVHRQGPLQAICMPFLGPNTLADIIRTVEVSQAIPHSGKSIVSTMAIRDSATVLGDESPQESTLLASSESGITDRLPQAEAIRRLGEMSYLDAAAWIMTRVADGLAFAHEHGVVHRDLKPGNILLTDDGEPLILDFNLAIQDSSVEQAVAIVGGTLPYSSPEQLVALRRGGAVDARSDVYSFGVLLFQLLTGQLPFPIRVGPFDEVVRQILEDRRHQAPSPREVNPAISPGLATIVGKCLSKDPDDRYGNTRHLHEDLQCHLEHRPLLHVPNRSIAERLRKWSRRHPKLSSASSVAAISAVLVAVLLTASSVLVSRLKDSRAVAASMEFHRHVVDAETSLNTPFVTDQRLRAGVESAEEVADAWGITSASGLNGNTMYNRLPADRQQTFREEALRLVYLLATGKAQLALRCGDAAKRGILLDQAFQLANGVDRIVGEEGQSTAFPLLRSRLRSYMHADQEPDMVVAPSPVSLDDPKHPRLLAYELAQQRRFREAAKILQGELRRSPHDHVLWFSLGNMQLSLGQFDDAEQKFSTAIAMNPEFHLAREHRGVARLEAKDYRGAKEDFDKLLTVFPDLTAGMVNRALALAGLGEVEEAIDELSRSLELGATQTRIHFLRARLRQQLGDLSGAEADRNTGRSKRPSDELSWVARGVHRLPDDVEGALADFQQALRIAPRSRSALQNMAHVLSERVGRTREAIQALDQILAADPDDPQALASRGVLRARMGQRQDAIRDAERVLSLSDEPLFIYQSGCILALTSKQVATDLPRAKQLVAQAIARDIQLAEIAVVDPDLLPLQRDAGFRKIAKAASQIQDEIQSP